MMFVSLGIGTFVAVTMISIVSYFTPHHPATTTTTTQPQPAIVGRRAPTAELPVLGTPHRFLVPPTNRAAIVVFFASWCGPCAEEMPQVATWYHTQRPTNVSLIAVASNDSAVAAQQFLADHRAELPALLDAQGNYASSGFGFATLPETVFIDRRGVVRHVVFGAVTAGELSRFSATLG